MTTKTSRLAGAAVGAFLAAGMAVPAHGRPARHPPTRSTEAAISRQAAEIEQLKAQVASLSARLLAQERQAEARQAQAAAQQVAAPRAAEIQTIPGAVKAQSASAPAKAGNTQISGRMYFDLSDIAQARDGAKIAPSGAGFDIKRLYVGIDHRFDDVWSGNITTDVAYVPADGLTQLYIKKAYLQARLSEAAIIRLGSADLPWIPFAEDVYGYRFIEATVADRTRFGTSADWGVHATGKLLEGRLGYAAAMIGGGGYKNPSRTKTMDFEGRVNLNIDKAVFAVGGYSGKLGKEVEGGVATPHRARRFNALAAWVDRRYRVGVEYVSASNWNNVTTAAADKSDGYAVFGSFNVTPQVAAFGRWDRVRPAKTAKPSEQDNYFNIGLNWEPVKIVDLALVYKRERVEDGLLSTSNGVIGGASGGTYDEVGVFGQFRW